MRVAILTSSYPRYPGDGTAPFVKSIAEALVKRGHSIEVIAPYDPEVQLAGAQEVKIHRFRYWLIKSQHIMGHGRALEADVHLRALAYLLLPFYLMSAFLALWRVTGRQKTELIHVHWVIPNGPVAAMVAGLRRIPYIISLHGSDIYLAKKNRLYGSVARWVFRHASRVTACSPGLKQGAVSLGAPQSTELIAWGADPLLFKPADNRRNLRNKYRSDERTIITALGRLVYKKGFEVFLQALPSIVSQRADIKVIIGGDGPLSKQLQELADSLGIKDAVHFIGRVPWNDVPDLFAASDIFVLPSVRDAAGNLDGLPTVLLEAMGCGAAVVASDIGGVSLAVRNHENGLLVKPGSVSDLSQALQLLINDPTVGDALGKAARQSVLDELNWDIVAQRIEMLFTSSIEKESATHRMGSIYREAMLNRFGYLDPIRGRVLDIGCHDGLMLSKLEADLRVGVDLQPVRKLPGVNLVRADARYLPFQAGRFDRVYALDVIEHIEDDDAFATSLNRVVAPGGGVILTTPSDAIRLNPPFLTAWISKMWGHIYRLGYSPTRLVELFSPGLDVEIKPWNAPAYRLYYPFMRVLQVIFPRWVEKWTKTINNWDAERQAGKRGFWIMVGVRKPGPSTIIPGRKT